MKIQVCGPGCAKCEQAEKTVREALAEAGAAAEVEKVSDFQKIAELGVFSTPAVVIDGEIKVSGRAPSRDEVLAWIGSA